MDEVPDVMDARGRLTRLVLALTVALIVGCAVYGALYAIARPDDAATAHAEGISTYRHARTAFQFVFYFSGAASVVAFLATLKLANRAAARRDALARMPRATLRNDR